MKRIIFLVLIGICLACSASAQHYAVQGGAVWPDGGISYIAPVGAPFDLRTHESLTYPYLQYASPLYWVPAPYISVPMGQPSWPGVR